MDIKEDKLVLIMFSKFYKQYSLRFLETLRETEVFEYYNIDGNVVIETKFSMN